MAKGNRDQPLQCKIEGDELVIRIGIGTLAFSAEHCQEFHDYDKHELTGSGPPYIKVSDANELASDVCRALTREEEDGTTELHKMLDAAFVDAMEDGSLGFEEAAAA